MGCFSFMCKECGEPILSNSFRGQKVKLFLLKNGKIIERMEGEYDSYGRCFKEVKGDNIDEWSIHWKMDWDKVCNLMFKPNKENGIAAIHSKCWQQLFPKMRSEDDPNQGWGEEGEYLNDYDESNK